LERTERLRLPAIMLSEATLSLIRDVFERPGLFHSAPRITRRVVKWGRRAEPATFDHAAVVVSERELLSELNLEMHLPDETASDPSNFTIFAPRPLPADTVEHCFGSRIASAAPVRLKDTSDSASCWIESLEDGWLFLTPNTPESGWLLSVGCPLGAIPERSSLIAGRIALMSDAAGQFPASPASRRLFVDPGGLPAAPLAWPSIRSAGMGLRMRSGKRFWRLPWSGRFQLVATRRGSSVITKRTSPPGSNATWPRPWTSTDLEMADRGGRRNWNSFCVDWIGARAS
jgi:hypothetical protein